MIDFRTPTGLKGSRKSLEERDFQGGRDGEIKGPGPFGSMALMVLKNFRDLPSGSGPGVQEFSRFFNPLSGTLAGVDRDV